MRDQFRRWSAHHPGTRWLGAHPRRYAALTSAAGGAGLGTAYGVAGMASGWLDRPAAHGLAVGLVAGVTAFLAGEIQRRRRR